MIKTIEAIPVYMTEEDAQKFLEFQKQYELFTLLINKGVFQTRNGSVTIHFDDFSDIRKVEVNQLLFKK